MSTFANIEDPEEKQHHAAFHLSLHWKDQNDLQTLIIFWKLLPDPPPPPRHKVIPDTNISWNKNTHFPEMAKQKRVDPDLAAPRGAI